MEGERLGAARHFWDLGLRGGLELWIDQVIQAEVQSGLIKSPKSQKSNVDTPTKAVVMTDGEQKWKGGEKSNGDWSLFVEGSMTNSRAEEAEWTDAWRPGHREVIESLSHASTKVLCPEVQESLYFNPAALKSDLKNVIPCLFLKSTSAPHFLACMHTPQRNNVSQALIRKTFQKTLITCLCGTEQFLIRLAQSEKCTVKKSV